MLFRQPLAWQLSTNGLPESAIDMPGGRPGRFDIADYLARHGLGSVAENPAAVTAHRVAISPFEACDRVFFRVSSADEHGDVARASFHDDWTAVRAEVRAHFDALVLGEAS